MTIPRLLSFAVLIAIIIFIGLLFYKVLIGFFVPVFLAAVLCVVFRPLHQWVLQKVGHRDRLAAVLTTILIMLALFLPFTMVVAAASVQGLRLVEQNDPSTVFLRITKVRDALGLQLPPYHQSLEDTSQALDELVTAAGNVPLTEENAGLQQMGSRISRQIAELRERVQEINGARYEDRFSALLEVTQKVGRPDEETIGKPIVVTLKADFNELRTELLGGSLMAIARQTANPTKEDVFEFTKGAIDYARPRLLSITGATGAFLIRFAFGSIILIVATFFFLYDGPSMVKTVMYLSPLDDNYEQELLLEFDRISRAVVVATLLSAVVQGLTAGLGYAVAGVNYLALLIMLTTVFAMVPFVGPAVVWVPVCLYLGLYEDRIGAALLLAAWGVLVVGTVDNLVKAFVLHGQSQLHPLLALLSVLGGVQALGPVGIVVGPMVVALLQTLLSILQRELVQIEENDNLALAGGSRLQRRRESAKAASAEDKKSNNKSTEPDNESAEQSSTEEDKQNKGSPEESTDSQSDPSD